MAGFLSLITSLSLTPSFVDSGIIPTDISDHYLIFSVFRNLFNANASDVNEKCGSV